MARPKTITSANAQLLLSLVPVFPVPVEIQGFAADAAFLFESVQSAETMIGVDGKMSAGWTPFITSMTISLQADSPSVKFFEDWIAAQALANELYFAFGTVALPGVQKSFALTKGALKNVTQAPPAAKVLQPQTFTIDWERVVASPLVLV